MNISLAGHAGLVSIWFLNVGVHIGVRKCCWVWGIEKSWYDGPLLDIGLGPLFCISIQK